jgi:DNA-binding NtrC family response regulator
MPQLDGNFEDQPLEGLTILLAEDEQRLRTIIAMMIEELGAKVVTVADGKSALDTYFKRKDEIDLVLLDMRMTGLSGANTFEQLVEFNQDVKVVLSSGVSPEDGLLETVTEHKGGFIEKPFNLEQLAQVLSAVLKGQPIIKTSS